MKKAIEDLNTIIGVCIHREKTEEDEMEKEMYSDWTYMLSNVLKLLKEQGKTGKWIDHTFAHGDDIECPFCHKKWNVIDNCTETFDYCPGCGAKLT